jgi:triphosphoribosyl-dephospho-CoA synthase
MTRDQIRVAYQQACRLEIEALKPGNVHVFAAGHDMTAEQFILSAEVSSGPLTDPDLPLGRRVLEAVRATRGAVGTNTNLGIILLCAPIAAAAASGGEDLRQELGRVLEGLGMEDARAVFEAIVLAQPGGLGSAGEHDVREDPKVGLLEAMSAAADRDLIARQYVTGFEEVFDIGLPPLESARSAGGMWPAVSAYMGFLSAFPDSHVARKYGPAAAEHVMLEARRVRAALAGIESGQRRIRILTEFDQQLKQRAVNPGTSADLTVACLLVHLLSARLA